MPIKAPVAGIAMGLIKEGDDFVVLSDIMGDEDHLGDMDFKVAGTRVLPLYRWTSRSMELPVRSCPKRSRAHAGRIHILDEMAKTISEAAAEMSEFAPRIISIKIDPEKIRDVIGKGGATIRGITEETGATIDIADDGTIKIASVDNAAAQEAKKRIERMLPMWK